MSNPKYHTAKPFFYRSSATLIMTVGIWLYSGDTSLKFFNPIHVEASSSYITTANLNLHSAASTSGKVLTTIPKGRSVTYLSKSGSWFKVKHAGKTGWVSSKYIKVTKPVSTKKPASNNINSKKTSGGSSDAGQSATYTTTANLNLRSAASTSGKVLTTIPKDRSVTYLSKSGSWFKVRYAGKTGWVSSKYIKVTKPVSTKKPASNNINSKKTSGGSSDAGQSATYTTTANLNLRSAASTSGKVLTTIPKGRSVTYLSKSGSWFKVKHAGKTGWVSSKYIKVTKPVSTKKPASNTDVRASDKTRPANQTKPASSEQKKIKTTATTLNLRNSASASSPILAKIPEGTILVPIASSKEWTQVSYGGYTGWISSAYTTTDSTKTEMTVHPYQTMDLRTISSVTAAQINNYIASKASSGDSVLYNKGQAFVNAGKKYGINALYLAAHAIHESDYGRSTISKAKNNLFGYGAFDSTPFVGAAKFDSIEGNIDFIARKMKSGYLKPGYMYYKGATLGYRVNNNGKRVDSQSTGMNYYYATDGNWGKAIALHMERMLDYSKEAAKNQAPNTFYPANPSYPNLKDVFPANTLAVANRNISLPNGKMILKGETFNLLEKHNNYVLTISDKGQRHTVFNISLSGYSSSFTVQNLGRIFTAVLNVRHAPNSTARAVGQLKNYQYVELVLDEAKKPQTSNGWYKVKLSNGQIGWASGQHITLELNK